MSRLPAPVGRLNGCHVSNLATATKPGRKPKAARPVVRQPKARGNQLTATCYATVGLSLGLSAWLNGMASARNCESGFEASAWVVGLAVPALVFLMGRIAGLTWGKGIRRLAAGAAAVGLVLLALSVHHCATSIVVLTGQDQLSALALAVGVDCGLVVGEVAAIVAG